MKNRSRKLLGAAVAVLLPVLAMTATYTGLATLQQDTTLRRGPDGATAGFLPAGMDVEVLREQEGWLLIRLEGWVPADAVATGDEADPAATDNGAAAGAAAAVVATGAAAAGNDSQPAAAKTAPAPPADAAVAAAPPTTGAAEAGAAATATGVAVAAAPEPAATAPASVPATAAPAAGAIEGLVKLKTGRKKAKPVTGMAVYLLPGDPGEDLLLYDEDNAEKIHALQTEAAQLKKEADRAMQDGSFSLATKKHDDLMRQRSQVLRELLALQSAEHGSHQAMAAARAQATVASSSAGWYTFSSLTPGTYTVYSRLANSDVDVEWVERVQLTSGVVNLQLDNVNVRGLP